MINLFKFGVEMGLMEAFSVGGGLVMEIMLVIIPIWTAFLLGLVIGWTWCPKWWKNLDKNTFDSFISKIGEFSAPSYSTSKGFPSIQSFTQFNLKFPSSSSQSTGDDSISANNQTSALQPR